MMRRELPEAWGMPTTWDTCRSSVGFVEIAPVLGAGVTVYKGLKVTDTRPATGS